MRRSGMFFRILAITIALMFSFGGVLTSVSAASLTQHSSVLADEGEIGPPAVNVCDYSVLQATFGPGSVAQMLTAAEANGQDVDCIDVWIESQSCGFLDARLIDRVTGWGFKHQIYWVEGDKDIYSQRNYTFPITFPEGYNGGEVVVSVFLKAPESDFIPFAGEDAIAFYAPNGGKQFTIDTNCLTEVVPAVEFVDATCDADADVVMTPVEGATYGIVGDVTAGGTVTVTATIDPTTHKWGDYSVTEPWWVPDATGASLSATYKFSDAPTDCVTPTVTPTETPTGTPTETPTGTPAETPTATATTPVTTLPGTGSGDSSSNLGMIALATAGLMSMVGVGALRRKHIA